MSFLQQSSRSLGMQHNISILQSYSARHKDAAHFSSVLPCPLLSSWIISVCVNCYWSPKVYLLKITVETVVWRKLSVLHADLYSRSPFLFLQLALFGFFCSQIGGSGKIKITYHFELLWFFSGINISHFLTANFFFF